MRSARLIAWLVAAGLFVWVFAGALFADGVWLFRDSGHFYYPLYQFTGEQLANGSPAWWNPYENLGMPLVANPTSALFYPPAWVFALPIDPAWAYRAYVLGHVLLAIGTSYALARRWNASTTAAVAAAISYAFCGNVLYQVCNVVFLVSAAWMPLALLAGERMVRARSAQAGVAFGTVMAAMTLGGDPQGAYHAGLLATLYAVVLRIRERSAKTPLDTPPPWRMWRPALLAVAAGVAFVLAAVQVLPSMQLTRHSSRGSSDVPRSVYELVRMGRDVEETSPRRWSDGLLYCRVDRAMHLGHVYHFSVGPWRLAEYIWPNVAGRQFPTHHRWADAIPSEGRLWVPSLYMGIVPLLLALAALRFCRDEPRTVWLSWSVLLAVLGSFGWFGAGWLLREGTVLFGGDPRQLPFGPPVGGLYWLMTVLLPGYVYFRYPAKLLTVAALALSMLAAIGWDRFIEKPSPRFRSIVFWLATISGAGTLAAVVMWFFSPFIFRNVAPNVMFGPLDTRGAAADVVLAFGQTAVLCSLFYWLLGRGDDRAGWRQAAVLVLVAIDLGVANSWMLPTADARLWRKTPWLAEQIANDQGADSNGVPARVYRRPVWLPSRWMETNSEERLVESLKWDRATGFPKHNLGSRFAVAEVYGTIMPHDYQVFLWYLKHCGGGVVPRSEDLAAAAVDYAELRASDSLDDAKQIAVSGTEPGGDGDVPTDVSVWRLATPMPRAWIVPTVDILPPLETDDWRAVWRRTAEVFHPEGTARDLRSTAVLEANPNELTAAGVPASFDSATDLTTATCRIHRYEPTRVEIQVETPRAGLVVLADQFFPGWRAAIETAGQKPRRLPLLRANRVMRGVWVPAGEHRLVFRYRPAALVYGGVLSMAGWLAVAVLAAVWWRQRCVQ